MSVYIKGCHNLGSRRGAAGIRWVEVKNHLARDVSGAKVAES